MRFSALLKQPSAFVPLAMSGAAIALLITVAATHGLVREPDEGAAAHTWQLLMGLQVPVIAWFAAKWLPQAPKPALAVLGLQAAAGLAAAAPVFILGL